MCLHSERKEKKKKKCLAVDLGEFINWGPGSNSKSCDHCLLGRRIDLVGFRQVVVELAPVLGGWRSFPIVEQGLRSFVEVG